VGQKRKSQAYRPKIQIDATVTADDSLALVVHHDTAAQGSVRCRFKWRKLALIPIRSLKGRHFWIGGSGGGC
jgi:hypothetical protein